MDKQKSPKNYHEVIIDMYNSGISRKAIAEKIGFAESYVFAVINSRRSNNVREEITDKEKPPKNYQELIVSMYNSGTSRKAIAEKFGIAESYVYAVINTSQNKC